MFILVQLLAAWIAWRMGMQLAQYFKSRRPPKLLALGFAPIISLLILLIIMTARYFIAGALLNDNILKVEFFSPFDPAFFGLYSFFAYGGAVSYYSRKQ